MYSQLCTAILTCGHVTAILYYHAGLLGKQVVVLFYFSINNFEVQVFLELNS